jgi:ribonuclease HI
MHKADVIFKDDKITHTKKYKLDGRCSNKHAEQLAIPKAPENIKNMDTNDKRVQIYTDSQIALESLKKPEES